jgi:hypothetical protein
MRKSLIVAVLTLCVAGAALADLGSVVRSFAIPGGACAGLARSNGLLYSVNYSQARIYVMNPTTGSVSNSFAAAGGAQTRGLAYQWGGNLWQNQGYNSPYRIYRTNTSTGSIFASYALPASLCHGSAPLATGDGGAGVTRIIISRYSPRTIYYMTTTGSVASSHTVTQALYDIAYDWRNKLIWGGMNTTTVYGFTTTGSLAASFNKPTGNNYGITYHGQYLFVSGTSGLIYTIHCPILNVGIAPSSMGKIKAMYK